MSDPIEDAITTEHSRQEHALNTALAQIDRAFGKDAKREYPADAIFVIIRSTGEYSNRDETPVVAFKSEDEAKQFVDGASAQARDAAAKFPFAWGPDSLETDEEEAENGRRTIMTLDPGGADDVWDTPSYSFVAVRLLAIADTLPTGPGRETGAVRSNRPKSS